MTLVASDSRPIRSHVSRAAGLIDGRRTFGRWFLASPFYSFSLGYRSPQSFFAVAPDSWPGDGERGRRLLAGDFIAHGIAGNVVPGTGDPPWRRVGASPLWLTALNGFGWMRDLRDCGEPGAGALAVRLVDDWSER